MPPRSERYALRLHYLILHIAQYSRRLHANWRGGACSNFNTDTHTHIPMHACRHENRRHTYVTVTPNRAQMPQKCNTQSSLVFRSLVGWSCVAVVAADVVCYMCCATVCSMLLHTSCLLACSEFRAACRNMRASNKRTGIRENRDYMWLVLCI